MPKRKINQRDYTHYLIGYRNNAPVIISGWSNAEDARDAKKEWPELRSSVWSKVGAKRTGLDPDDNSNWTTSRGDGGVKDSETDGFGGVSKQTRKGTRVRFVGSSVGYTHHPMPNEEGTVTTMPGYGSRTYLPGPGGGLLYVTWDESGTIGISPNDVAKVTRRSLRYST